MTSIVFNNLTHFLGCGLGWEKAILQLWHLQGALYWRKVSAGPASPNDSAQAPSLSSALGWADDFFSPIKGCKELYLFWCSSSSTLRVRLVPLLTRISPLKFCCLHSTGFCRNGENHPFKRRWERKKAILVFMPFCLREPWSPSCVSSFTFTNPASSGESAKPS